MLLKPAGRIVRTWDNAPLFLQCAGGWSDPPAPSSSPFIGAPVAAGTVDVYESSGRSGIHAVCRSEGEPGRSLARPAGPSTIVGAP